MMKTFKTVAVWSKDSRRYHRFDVRPDDLVVGTIYVAKGEDIPDELHIELKTRRSYRDEEVED